MNIADVTRGERCFTVTWDDQSEAEFPFIWLRDNDPDDLHPDTCERVSDLTSVDLDIRAASFLTDAESLRITWPQKEFSSIYPAEWLRTHRPGSARPDASKVMQTFWDRTTLGEIPQCDAVACKNDVGALFFNAHIADLPIEILYDFYAAYRRLMLRIRDERYAVRQLALLGQLIVFDNTQVLHGRAEFDVALGERYFRGYYMERNEVDSRMRVLARLAA